MEKRDSITISGFLCQELKKEFGIISAYKGNPVKDSACHKKMYEQLCGIEDYLNSIWIESVK